MGVLWLLLLDIDWYMGTYLFISAVHSKDGYSVEFCVFRIHDFYTEGLRLTLDLSVMGQSSLSTIVTISLLSGHGRLVYDDGDQGHVCVLDFF